MTSELESNDYEIINGRKIVKKHVAVIHCSNRLSLRERCISNVLLYHAFPDLKTKTTFEITLEQLKRLLNITTRNHQPIKDSLKNLMSTVIEWNMLGDSVPEMELEGWNATTLLSWVGVSKGIIKYRYDESIKSLFIDPAIYGKINLIIQSRFKSSYALALYENCVRYRGLKYTKNFEFTVFRKLMGVEEGKYEIFRDFNKRVLIPAVTEINTCSDIFIVPKITRKGRKVHSILFELSERSIKKRLGIKQNSEINTMDVLLTVNGLSPENLEELIRKYGKEKVEQGIRYVLSLPSYAENKIKNIGAYIRRAIQHNYSLSEPVNINIPKKKKKITAADEEQYQKYLMHEVMNFYTQLSVDRQNEILAQFESYLINSGNMADTVAVKVYKKHGIESVMPDFLNFFKKMYLTELGEIKGITQFLAEQVAETV